VINIKTKITDEFIGKYAKLKVGFASGLIGLIEKNVEELAFLLISTLLKVE
jgi:hypothetical protein